MRHLSAVSLAKRFVRDHDGQFAVIAALTLSMMMLAVGFGVNLGQIFHTKSSLRSALDAAVTSTARDITTGVIKPKDARASVDRFLQANSNVDFTKDKRFTLTDLVIDPAARTIEATAVANVALAFPLFTTKDPRVSNTTAAVYSDKTIEVAMMLDVTGSMGKRDKIGDLKTAAENAVSLLLDGQNVDDPRVRVAIVPYAEAVNVGKLAESSVFVELPGGANLPPLIDDVVSVAAPSRPDNCATERKDKDGKADFSDDAPDTERKNKQNKTYLAKVNRDDRISTNWRGSLCPDAAMVPLTADKSKLLAAIDAFRADGVTAGGIAAQWGYYMLSPKWRLAIKNAGLGAGPANHNTKKVAKVAILMTDGQFNTAFAGVVGTPQMQQGAKSRSYAESICANMKADGIQVFTIGFDLDDPDMRKDERDAAKGVLKKCASPATSSLKYYFEASTGEELDAAFKEIIRNTERLALTK